MTIKQKVLFIGKLNTQAEIYKQFHRTFECIHYQISSKEELIQDFQTNLADVEAIYGGWGGFDSVGGFNGEVLEFCPPALKIVAICSIGYDGYDVNGMRKKGITLTNVPSMIASEAVADLVLYNTISSFRNFKFFENNFKDKYTNTGVLRTSLVHSKFDSFNGQPIIKPITGHSFAHSACGREILSPRGHNAVIVGFGSIGKLIGQRLSSIGMNVHYIKRSKMSDSEASQLGYEATYHASLSEVNDIVDLLIIACPGSAQTKHMINETTINAISKPFRIINIGRGYIIDERALIEGLRSSKILFAGLDVFEYEPVVNPDLIGRQDVVLTPHIGSSTTENFNYTMCTAMENIKTVLLNIDGDITRVN
ncbi:hydroxyisocaproate dehydrogenase [Scheffersomyces amazonensis]|uniref:hydroxyisocaproate dehydrogenase n=1 Tax=Scheffersomyces amazonensis TaxID=1078765 RepID=UPI00315CDA0F